MIVVNPSTNDAQLKSLLYESRTINISVGCTVEYNMNEMLDNILVSTTSPHTASLNEKINPFNKLFPMDSVIMPNRPQFPGVKYYILSDQDHKGSANPPYPNKFYDYRTTPYPANAPRVYYPGVETYYKYWISPVSTGLSLSVKYIIEDATISKAYATGEKIVYTTSEDHGFKVGNRVKITGFQNTSFNFANKEIIEIKDSKSFSVESNLAATNFVTIGVKKATLVNSAGVETPTKPALANKIVVKFEKYHVLPATCTIQINYKNGTSDSPAPFSVPSNGILNIYWNGTAWTLNEPFTSSQAISYPDPKEIKSIAIFSAAVNNSMIAVIEISARWVKDITSDVVSFNIDKESTSNPEDLLPVGNITANNLYLRLLKYDPTNIRVIDYNRDLDWTSNPTPNNVIYFTKNMQLKPYFKIFHSNGAVTEGSLKYDRINQGTFYAFNYSIDTYGDVSVEAIDAAKILMETFCPDLLFKNAPVTAVIMSLLDSVGFTNYNINISTSPTDTSIPSLSYWWTEEQKTVWETLQELCRDTQINAFVDENNILQIYTRDKMYNDNTVDWEFYQSASGNKLPNIISFSKKDLATANQVQIIWKTPIFSGLNSKAKSLWQSDTSYLIAGGLSKTIEAATPAENIEFILSTDVAIDANLKIDSSFNYNGYFLIDSEIFEYDALQFEYVAIDAADSAQKIKVFISSEADWHKTRVLAKSGIQNFYPTGRFRIKRRGVFGTKPAKHEATLVKPNTWYIIKEDIWT